MSRVTLFDRLRYASDNAFSRGTVVLIGWLAATTTVIVLGIAFVIWITGLAPGYNFPQLVWMGLMRTLDPGTMGGDEGSWLFLLAMLAITLTGIFILSTLIGILTSGIDSRLDTLRKGRSRVIESNHTVILGWSQAVFTILAQLTEANANQRSGCIVILGPQDKVDMEDAIRAKVGNTGRTRIVCRTGNPIEIGDLELTNLSAARSIIILSPEVVNPDAEVIKTLLAVVHSPMRRAEPYHIVAELRDPKNFDVAKMVGQDEVEIVLAGDLIARIIAQMCRQSGLSVVYQELLSFSGDEIYMRDEPALAGKTFGEALHSYESSCLIGIQPAGQSPRINPPLDLRIGAGDRLVVIAADDDKMVASKHGSPPVRFDAIRSQPPSQRSPERTLILGWNWRAPATISELDRYVAQGSQVTVVADYPEARPKVEAVSANLRNMVLTFQVGDTADRRILDALDIPSYDHVITLSYSDTMAVQAADSRTLVTLLHLRDIASRYDRHFSVVSEMLDVRNRNLADVTQVDDIIVSDRTVSLVLAQVSENKQLNHVFGDIFDVAGSEIYLKPVQDYVEVGLPLNFHTVVAAAALRSEIAVGYRRKEIGADSMQNYGVVVNPNKTEEVVFADGDTIVVFAEQ